VILDLQQISTTPLAGINGADDIRPGLLEYWAHEVSGHGSDARVIAVHQLMFDVKQALEARTILPTDLMDNGYFSLLNGVISTIEADTITMVNTNYRLPLGLPLREPNHNEPPYGNSGDYSLEDLEVFNTHNIGNVPPTCVQSSGVGVDIARIETRHIMV